MNAIWSRFLVVFAGVSLSLAVGVASAQYYQRGHVDHHDHVIRDSHGHVVGRTHHDVYHPGRVYVTPSTQYPPHDPHHHHPGPAAPYNAYPAPHAVQRPAVPQFGAYSHVDELATRLETLTSDLLLDLHFNYSHNPGFQETYREAYAIYETAKYVHSAEHSQDRTAIAARLGGLDSDFHHIQGDVRGWSRHHHRQVGQLGILTKMDMIEQAIHHLMTDVGVQAINPATVPVPYPAGQTPPPPLGGLQPAPGLGPAPNSASPLPNSPATVPGLSGPAPPPTPVPGAPANPASVLDAPPSPPPTIVTTPPPAN